jgi:regulator of replication initiation timing
LEGHSSSIVRPYILKLVIILMLPFRKNKKRRVTPKVVESAKKLKDLTASQIVSMLKQKTIIGFSPESLRKRLKELNKTAFDKDKKKRGAKEESVTSRISKILEAGEATAHTYMRLPDGSFDIPIHVSDGGGLTDIRRRRQMETEPKQLKVVSVSSTKNSFGLRGYVLMDRSGDAWEVGKSDGGSSPAWSKDQLVSVPAHKGRPNWSKVGVEIPRELGTAPPKVVREVWAGSVNESRGGSDPSKEEMLQALKEQGYTDTEEAEVAMYWFANHYHSGQSSNLYSILSTSPYQPGPNSTLQSEGYGVEDMYSALEHTFGNGGESEGFDESLKLKLESLLEAGAAPSEAQKAEFKRQHGGGYDPNSRVDRAKMAKINAGTPKASAANPAPAPAPSRVAPTRQFQAAPNAQPLPAQKAGFAQAHGTPYNSASVTDRSKLPLMTTGGQDWNQMTPQQQVAYREKRNAEIAAQHAQNQPQTQPSLQSKISNYVQGAWNNLTAPASKASQRRTRQPAQPAQPAQPTA